MHLFLIGWLAGGLAQATEVVWLQAPTADVQRWVADQANAQGPVMTPQDLRFAAEQETPEDGDALQALSAALAEARQYEMQLDGELVIMQDLVEPLSRVTLLRNEADRDALYTALTYQGFAVARYYGDALGSDPGAADFRLELDGAVVPAPWADAVAIQPAREVSAYEIAEAAQRIAYETTRNETIRQLPASLSFDGLPSDSTIVVNGTPEALNAASVIRLVPGRHWVHIRSDDRIIERWVLRVEPGERRTLSVSMPEAEWQAFVADLGEGSVVPPGLHADLEALGGEVWLARPGARSPTIWSVTPTGVTPVTIDQPKAVTSDRSAPSNALSLNTGLGWFYSGDFYQQSPNAAPPSQATVNAIHTQFGVDVGQSFGPVWASAGVDTAITIGAHAVAFTGNFKTRFRPQPYVAVGVRPAQLTVGYLLPYHPAIGGRIRLPLSERYGVYASGLYGVPMRLRRPEQATYNTWHIGSLTVGATFTL